MILVLITKASTLNQLKAPEAMFNLVLVQKLLWF